MTDIPEEDDRGAPSLWERLRRWSGLPATETGTADESDASPKALDAHERTLIRNVLRLRNLSAEDVMVPRIDIVAVEVETSFDAVVTLLVEEGHSRLPVYKDDLDHVLGMVHVKDVMGFVAARRTATLQNLLRNVLFVAPSTRLLDLLTQMRLQRVHMAFVVDEFGGIDGLITIEDVVEEIVGDIEDEHDETEPAYILERPDGSLMADARTPIDELETRLGVKLVSAEIEEEVDTVGGLIVTLTGRVPARGEKILHPAGIEFEVTDADQRRIRRLRIHRITPEESAEDDGA